MSDNEEFLNLLTTDEFKFFKNNKRNIFLNLKGSFKKNYKTMDIFPHMIPLIDSSSSKILDLQNKCIIDPKKEYFCTTSTNWSYNLENAKKYLKEVEEFLNKIFPIKSIQEIVLAYIYKTLMGDKFKMFMILTDNLNGNNGKSTFLNFLSECFGSNYICNGRKYLIQSNVVFNSNNHDAGFYNLKNKRFLIINETCKKFEIDTEFLKDMADEINIIRGRKFQSAEQFEFPLYANAIIACNNDKFYKFDVEDENILKRMLVIQMQSRFHMLYDTDDWENLQFKRENVKIKFSLWRSSFIDILLNIGKRLDDILLNLENNELLNQWKEDLLSKRVGVTEDNLNEFKVCVLEKIQHSDNQLDWLSCNDLKKCLKDSDFGIYFKKKDYIQTMKSWLKQYRYNRPYDF